MLDNIMEVIHLSEKLKSELRHSWLSDGRQESVAEHTWRVSLMGMLISPYLEKEIDQLKLLKMIIIHDLVEAEAGDIPAFDTLNDDEAKLVKAKNEEQAILRIMELIGGEQGQEWYDLWHEFEDKQTYEAKVANALDKLEAQIQHNEADIKTWLPIEYDMSYMLGRHTSFSPVLTELKDLIEQEANTKIKRATRSGQK
ncbi:HD domain-containing protein [Tenuibacillus multivorans]|uniref:Putative hydrolases of HD superfamily n=1 Tax=Tenuibacillus multivorans TaxID=237069 RepID=A0A1H0B548_9BACI|nr:HD domain-containing protein [Tenuibacillus multivorans]GEL78642.1 haloacid dehalogenase [Tenuibacillus multivorans]SDN40746.1 putative hydrolases of HD superfamily [Tenuibacillus multivorans]